MLFGIEFVLIFHRAAAFTSASRAAVFLYTAPFFVALGSYRFLGERLRAVQWAGLGRELCRRRAGDRRAAAECRCQCAARRSADRRRCGLWAATTLIVKATPRCSTPRRKRRWATRSRYRSRSWPARRWLCGRDRSPRPERAVDCRCWPFRRSGWSGCTFLLWFALMKTYSASKLSAFTFITPLFGVVAGYFIMHDHADPRLRRRRATGDRGAVSREPAGSEGRRPIRMCRRRSRRCGLAGSNLARARGCRRMRRRLARLAAGCGGTDDGGERANPSRSAATCRLGPLAHRGRRRA